MPRKITNEITQITLWLNPNEAYTRADGETRFNYQFLELLANYLARDDRYHEIRRNKQGNLALFADRVAYEKTDKGALR